MPPLPLPEALQAFYPLCTQGCVESGMKPGHLDGWGASGFQDGRAVYFGRRTQAVSQSEPEYKQAELRAVKSKTPVLVAHFRKTSGAPAAIANTHPFHWRDWVFAHTGTIHGAAASIPLNESAPQGETDSERFFLWIWERIHAEVDPTAALAALLKKGREHLVYSSLNFLMSDGRTLWAYHDFSDKRMEPGETPEGRKTYFALYTAQSGTSAVVCSEPLSSLAKKWKPMEQRTLAAFAAGKFAPQTYLI